MRCFVFIRSCLIYEWFVFIPILSIFFTWYSMMMLHDFNIICDMFCDPIKDAFLKDVKNTWGRVFKITLLRRCFWSFWKTHFIPTTLEFQIDGTPRLLIIPLFVTLPNLTQHSPYINFGEFCQPPLLFQTPRLLIHVHSQQR